MRIIKTKDYTELSRKAANIISAQVLLKPKSILGLATGSTPLGLYDCLIKDYKAGEIDFSAVRTVNLDEYYGLSPYHPQSYRFFMQDKLFKHINLKDSNAHLPSGIATDKERECKRYDDLICDMGGIDIQLLGLGHNGHIGFNEPDDKFTGPTHCVSLTQSTIDANKRFFDSIEDVPTSAITMGMSAIMQAKAVLLIVSGKDKAEILKAALYGPITPNVPASILQLHSNVTVVADEDALS